MVRHQVLVLAFGGSSPSSPAICILTSVKSGVVFCHTCIREGLFVRIEPKGAHMTKNIGQMSPEMSPSAEIIFNGRSITHYMDPPTYPEGDRGAACRQHIGQDAGGEQASEMLNEFNLMGCHFPEAGEPQVIRTAFVCPGASILGKCRLRLIQANPAGEVLTEGRFS